MVCACALFLVLIACNEVVMSVDGRHLKHGASKKCMRKSEKTNLKATQVGEKPSSSSSGRGREHESKVEHVDDFRPTTPGHSPGVGHSLHN